jgi:photosystem II stability/assembly factor-like uncharacterized protein
MNYLISRESFSLITRLKMKAMYCFLTVAAAVCFFTSSAHSQDILSVKFVNNNFGYISGMNGYLSKTTDGGITWSSIGTQLPYDIWDICSLGEDIIIAACSNGKILKTTDGGLTWESKIGDLTDDFRNIFFTYDARIIACGKNSSLFISNDLGETWEKITIPVISNLNRILFLDGIGGYGFIVGSSGTLLTTTDGGASWAVKLYSNNRTDFTAISMTDEKTGTISGSNGIIIHTINGWITYKQNSPPSGNLNLNGIKYLDNSTAIALGSNFILRTVTNGREWSFARLPISFNGTLNSIYFPSVSKGFAVGAGGVILVSTDQGQIWSYLVTPSVTDSKGSAQHTKTEGANNIYNYPNPFNPSTMISYSLTENSFVKIRIYDITGREISFPVNQYELAGEHSVQFNAEGLTSGVYFYSVTVDNGFQSYRKTTKMLLIK